jgi:hypothetical protein
MRKTTNIYVVLKTSRIHNEIETEVFAVRSTLEEAVHEFEKAKTTLENEQLSYLRDDCGENISIISDTEAEFSVESENTTFKITLHLCHCR